VVRQKGERSFHVLYYLADGLGGGSSPEGRALFLEKPSSYAYLSREHRKVPGLNDGAMWRSITACMASLGIGPAAQKPVYAALATVLALGNVDLTSETEREQAEADASKAAAAAAAADEAAGSALPTSPEAPGASSSSGGPKAALNPQAAVLADDPETAKAVAAVTALLGVSKEALAAALTHRTITVGGASTATILTAPQARAARDSLAKVRETRDM
jgi:myosin heavy subunit